MSLENIARVVALTIFIGRQDKIDQTKLSFSIEAEAGGEGLGLSEELLRLLCGVIKK